MRALVGAGRLLRVLGHLLYGMGIVAWRFPHLGPTERQARIQDWSAALLRHLGVQLSVIGQPQPGAGLLVANHVSWLDITAIHSTCARARFVSKADVLKWPLLGWLIRQGGTLFIERERKRDAMRVVHEMAAAMQAGDLVAVFPEGTTGQGPQVLPFHANLLQAAIAAQMPVQPVVLRYCQPGQPFAEAAVYVGDTSLAQSLWWIACARGLAVEVRFLPPQEVASLDRRALAERLRAAIQAALIPVVAEGSPLRSSQGR
jgi:1-acyl-sn-glycerol-3-phosphate acyltransferase